MNTVLLDPPVTLSPEFEVVRGALDALLETDLACVERDELAVVLREARRVRGFVDAFFVRAAQRGRELELRDRPQIPPAPDAAPAPADTRGDHGRDEANLVGLLMSSGMQSTRDARELGARSAVCSQFPALEAALARGEISAGHVDAVARQLTRLTEVEICELRSRESEIVRAACREFVDPFNRWLRNLILEIREQHRPGSDGDELAEQERLSEVTTFIEEGTGLRVTMIKLDPLRDHELQLALRAHLNRLRHDPANRKLSFQELKVAAFMTAVTAPFKHGTPPSDNDDQPAGQPAGPGRRSCTTSITRPTSQPSAATSDRSSDGRSTANDTNEPAGSDTDRCAATPGDDTATTSPNDSPDTPSSPSTTHATVRTGTDTSSSCRPPSNPHGGAPPAHGPEPNTTSDPPTDSPTSPSNTTTDSTPIDAAATTPISTNNTTQACATAATDADTERPTGSGTTSTAHDPTAPARRRARVRRPVRNVTVVSRVPKMLIVADLRTLISGPHERTIAELSDGTPVPLDLIRELLPHSDLVPILLSGKGQPLWVGRTRRLATPAQRDALTALYRTCARPSCDTPIDLTQAHHAQRNWEHNGHTNIDELVPLCTRDHDAIHHGGHCIHITDNHATITWYRNDGTTESVTHGGNRTPPPR